MGAIAIQFSCVQGAPGTTTITATYIATGAAALSQVTVQSAVPKFMTMNMDPPSSWGWGAWALPHRQLRRRRCSRLSATRPITQVMHVTNSMHGQKPLAVRLKILVPGTPGYE